MKLNSKVKIQRSELAPSLAADLPDFIFWNDATVKEIKKERVKVECGGQFYWFDRSAVEVQPC